MQAHKQFIFGIGVEKCGTSSLHQAMANSGQFNLPRKKETFFFNKNYAKGFDHYEQLFSHPFESPLVPCDITPSYFRQANVFERLQAFKPDWAKKIIICLRHPLERAFSFYLHDLRLHISKGERSQNFARKSYFSFYELWEKRNAYYFTPYSALVENSFAQFGAENCHIMLFEDMIANWPHEAKKIDHFLGLPALAGTKLPHENRAETIPHFVKWQAQEKSNSLFNLHCLRQDGEEIMSGLSAEQIHNAMALQGSYSLDIPQSFNKQIMQVLQKDIDRLSKLLDRDLSAWQTIRDFKTRFTSSL